MAEAIDHKEPIVFLLTNNQETKQRYQQLSNDKTLVANVVDMQDFVQAHSADFPELINFLGFSDSTPLQQLEGEARQQNAEMADDGTSMFEEHLDTTELILGIKEGRYF